jgi:hypothetical protein
MVDLTEFIASEGVRARFADRAAESILAALVVLWVLWVLV